MQPNPPAPPPQRDPDDEQHQRAERSDADVAAAQMRQATSALRAMFPLARGGSVRDESDVVDV